MGWIKHMTDYLNLSAKDIDTASSHGLDQAHGRLPQSQR